MDEECRHPEKVKLWTKSEAAGFRARLSRVPGNGGWALQVYRCGDHWHVGHDPVKVKRRRRAGGHG